MTDARKRLTKNQFITALSESTGLSKKEVQAFLDSKSQLIATELGADGPGELVIPDMLKLSVKQTAAIPAGERKDPFTGEMRMFPDKPAARKVRASPLKKLKDMV